jgi:hypothetical protein
MQSSIRIAEVEQIGHRSQRREGVSDILPYTAELSDPHVKNRRSLPKKVQVMTVNTDRAIQNTFDVDVDDLPQSWTHRSSRGEIGSIPTLLTRRLSSEDSVSELN